MSQLDFRKCLHNHCNLLAFLFWLISLMLYQHPLGEVIAQQEVFVVKEVAQGG